MRHISSMLHGLARSISLGKERKGDQEQGTVLKTSGTLWGEGSETFAAVCSRRGEKGTNQDCSIVWEGFGCQDDSIFCGIFDGHGQWGHYVSKAVRDSLPPSLLSRWQEAVALTSLIDGEKLLLCDYQFDLWRQSYLAAAAAVDEELRRSRRLDSVNSGCTALSIIKQGDLMMVANVGDSRAVLATTSDDGGVAAVQLTVDNKPNLPQEKERIRQCKGRVYYLRDEPGVHRVWLPDQEAPGLAMSRAFGDYCVKDYGVISAPEVTQRRITTRDQFVILATGRRRQSCSCCRSLIFLFLQLYIYQVGLLFQGFTIIGVHGQRSGDTNLRRRPSLGCGVHMRVVAACTGAWAWRRRPSQVAGVHGRVGVAAGQEGPMTNRAPYGHYDLYI